MISVLTLVKNREAHLLNLVEGLRRSVSAPAELVIVDMSDAAVAPPSANFPVRLVRLETDALPLAQARNLAAANASAPSLLFLDVDCIPGSDLISAMEQAVIGRDALICAEVKYLTAGDTRSGAWSEACLKTAGMPYPARQFPSSGLTQEANFGLFWSLAFGMSRDAFTRVGGFDEAFTGYGAEDTDFAFRAKEAGLDLLFLGGASAYHQHHGVFDPPLQHFHDIVRNARTFHGKWGFWPMRGWLSAFEELGLLIWSDDKMIVVRHPSEQEIRDVMRPADQRF